MKVTHTKMVFSGGSRVPAGTPFEVADDAVLEPGMVKVEDEAPTAKVKAAKSEPTAKGKVEGKEPDTMAAMTKLQAEADKKADPARG